MCTKWKRGRLEGIADFSKPDGNEPKGCVGGLDVRRHPRILQSFQVQTNCKRLDDEHVLNSLVAMWDGSKPGVLVDRVSTHSLTFQVLHV